MPRFAVQEPRPPPASTSDAGDEKVQRRRDPLMTIVEGGNRCTQFAHVHRCGELGDHDHALAGDFEYGIKPYGRLWRVVFQQQRDNQPRIETGKQIRLHIEQEPGPAVEAVMHIESRRQKRRMDASGSPFRST